MDLQNMGFGVKEIKVSIVNDIEKNLYNISTITVLEKQSKGNDDDDKDKIEEPVNEVTILKYLHYAFNEHFVNAYSKESIRKKVIRCIKEY